uniref:Uncharacterized protein B15B24.030 n=1 Tax=Neurospora crassa TaxID=5141 RepID=Q873G9_NEUCS|nr:hypothetical protein [Neurospora crassa]
MGNMPPSTSANGDFHPGDVLYQPADLAVMAENVRRRHSSRQQSLRTPQALSPAGSALLHPQMSTTDPKKDGRRSRHSQPGPQ